MNNSNQAEGLLQCKDDKGLMKLFLTDHTPEAYEQIREAAYEENAIALYMMAEYFSQGYGVQPIDKKTAIKCFKKSYEAGYPVAGYDIAASLLDGSSEQNEILNHAKDKILELANEGDAFAQTNAAWVYIKGYGTAVDHWEAEKWVWKAVKQEFAGAQFALGCMCRDGACVARSYKEAVDWFLKAAEQGDANAQYNLGDMYENGRSVEQDHEKAAKWYLKAAEQGLANAQNKLGWMYEFGRGVEQDHEKAAEWWQKAADQGLALAWIPLWNIKNKAPALNDPMRKQ